MAKYTVGFRASDVFFKDTFETKEAAFDQANAWAKAGLTDVTINDGEREYNLEDFAKKVNNLEKPK